MDPAWVMALRLIVAGVFLSSYALISNLRFPRSRELWAWFALLGVLGHALPFFLISWGTQHVSSGLSGVLMGSIPLMAIVFAHFMLPDERLSIIKFAGFACGFIGLMIVIGVGQEATPASPSGSLWGELAILVGCLCYAVHGIYARRIPFSGPVVQSAAVCLCGALVGTLFAFLWAPQGPGHQSFLVYLSVLGLGILPTGIATLLVYRLLPRCGVSFVTLSNYLVPVYALVLGALTLGEPLAVNVAFGLALILAGIAISRRHRPKTVEAAAVSEKTSA
jgi:drug/metabolite transporter (DMT)-like permease